MMNSKSCLYWSATVVVVFSFCVFLRYVSFFIEGERQKPFTFHGKNVKAYTLSESKLKAIESFKEGNAATKCKTAMQTKGRPEENDMHVNINGRKNGTDIGPMFGQQNTLIHYLHVRGNASQGVSGNADYEVSDKTLRRIEGEIEIDDYYSKATAKLIQNEKEFKIPSQYGDINNITSGYERATLVKERCHLLQRYMGDLPLFVTKHLEISLMVTKQYNLMVCANQKVASTSTKRMLYALDHNSTVELPFLEYRKYSRKLFRPLFQGMRDGVFNVTIVREPLERLLSAYRDQRAYAYKDITFLSFVKQVLKDPLSITNVHVFSYVLRCNPCAIDYNFIGLQEQFDSDYKQILMAINAPKGLHFWQERNTEYKLYTEDVAKSFFKEIPNSLIHKLWEKFYLDYFLFGFPYPSHLISANTLPDIAT